jgi:putative solute:sodium symporter small subunit
LLPRKERVYTPGNLPLRPPGADGSREVAAKSAPGVAFFGTGQPPPSPMRRRQAMQLTQKHLEYWSKNLRMTGFLLFVWFVATFVVGFYSRELSFNFFGWPFSFYMMAQGSLIIYVIIIWFYARYMNNLDLEYDVHEGEED